MRNLAWDRKKFLHTFSRCTLLYISRNKRVFGNLAVHGCVGRDWRWSPGSGSGVANTRCCGICSCQPTLPSVVATRFEWHFLLHWIMRTCKQPLSLGLRLRRMYYLLFSTAYHAYNLLFLISQDRSRVVLKTPKISLEVEDIVVHVCKSYELVL